MGLFAASTSTGTLVFIPALSAICREPWLEAGGDVRGAGHGAADPAGVFPAAGMAGGCRRQTLWRRCPITPAEIRQRTNPLRTAFAALGRRASRNRDFWLLATTFFVCGFTTNGLVGTHMIALVPRSRPGRGGGGRIAGDHGTVRSGRHHRLRLADRPARSAQAAVRLLRPARPVADLSALRQLHLLRPVAVRGVLWPGLDRHRAARPWPSPTGLRHPKGARSCSAGSPPATRSAPPRAAFFAGASRTATGSYLRLLRHRRLCRGGGSPAGVDDRQERTAAAACPRRRGNRGGVRSSACDGPATPERREYAAKRRAEICPSRQPASGRIARTLPLSEHCSTH